MYRLTCQIKAPVSLQRAFTAFESPYNLARITPAWLNFRITTPGPVIMQRGAEIDYQIRWLGIPMSWKTVISAYEPPLFFEDEQVRGPYAIWRHRHTFEEVEEGTLISDSVDYALPWGALGRLAAPLVKRQLRGIFEFRQRAQPAMLGGNASLYAF